MPRLCLSRLGLPRVAFVLACALTLAGSPTATADNATADNLPQPFVHQAALADDSAELERGGEADQDYASGTTLRRPEALPPLLAMPGSGASAGTTASSGGSAIASRSRTLALEQHFSEPVLHVGEASQLNVTVTLHNVGAQPLSGLSADVYFILEDAALIHAPGCRARVSTSRQPILSCAVPGTLAPGATRDLTYTVAVDAKPSPIRLWSTVLVGALRHDAAVNVVYDVLAGEDVETGLTDFNRALLDEVPIDKLGNVVIDILALYTPDATEAYGPQTPTRINQMISVSNQIFHDSGVGITLRPVFHTEVDYPGAAHADMYNQLEQLTFGRHGAFNEVRALRDRFGADLVVLFRTLGPRAVMCGVANLGGHGTWGDMFAFNGSDYGFSVVALDCPLGGALVHELGHNLGLTHSRREDGSGGTLPYATGHGIDHGFATVMANPARFGSASRMPLLSSPQLDCQGLPCGVDHRDPLHGADAVRTLNLTRFQVAAYRPTRVPHLPSQRVEQADGLPSRARIALTARTNRESLHTQRIGAEDVLDVAATFYVDPDHVGRIGHFHIVADLHQAGLGYAQLDEHGQLYEWNGEVSDLVPFNTARPLAAVEYLQVLSGFAPLPEMAGYPLVLLVAYQLPETGEVVYTSEPLIIEIDSLATP